MSLSLVFHEQTHLSLTWSASHVSLIKILLSKKLIPIHQEAFLFPLSLQVLFVEKFTPYFHLSLLSPPLSFIPSSSKRIIV